jgi:homoserine O-succinyltransferase
MRIGKHYSSLGDLWNNRLDGAIVTGTEPRAADLRDEPYWRSMVRLADWTERNTHSTLWSCLAAHAAVLHRDGIERRRLNMKLSGIYDCARVADHVLVDSLPADSRMPHSRWNDLPERDLRAGGYHVLTRSATTGADVFVKPGKSLSVFFQGHPEYDADSLILEYRRDIRRFLRGERDLYPAMPQGCFDETAAARLRDLEARARAGRSEAALAEFPAAIIASNPRNTWRAGAVGVYRNWLRYLGAQKETRLRRAARALHPVGPATFAPALETRARSAGRS